MIVCVCNALCEKRCQEFAGRADCRTVGCIYRGFGCRVRCGKCVPFMTAIFSAAKGPSATDSGLAGAATERSTGA